MEEEEEKKKKIVEKTKNIQGVKRGQKKKKKTFRNTFMYLVPYQIFQYDMEIYFYQDAA